MKVGLNTLKMSCTPQFKCSNRETIVDGKVVNRNCTSMFRSDIYSWPDLAKNLLNKYKDVENPKIYCYACSDGSEPYTLAIALMAKGGKEAQKFFPIIARDFDPYIIEQAQSGQIKFENNAETKIYALGKKSPEDFFEDQPGTSMKKIKDNLRNCVKFERRNIITDLPDLDLENSVLMFRNAWPYLNPDIREPLVSTISEKMDNSSALIIGSFDCFHADLDKILPKYGLYAQNQLLTYAKTKPEKEIEYGLYYHPSFTSNRRETTNEKNEIINRNSSWFFRNDLNWDKFANKLINEYKDVENPKIYCYACSDGSEPYSLAILLTEKLGKEGAKKFFPIIARDIDPDIIKMAQSGSIEMFPKDFKNIMALTDGHFHRYFKTSKDIKHINVNDYLKSCVQFRQGDILKTLPKNLNNSVLMFRNAWPYLEVNEQKDLIKKIAQKVSSNTIIAVGNFDDTKTDIEYEFAMQGLKMSDDLYYVYKKVREAVEPRTVTSPWLR